VKWWRIHSQNRECVLRRGEASDGDCKDA